MQDRIVNRIRSLMADGTVDRALGWKKGETAFDPSPAVFHSPEELTDFVYNDFCGANLSKFLIRECEKEGRILVCLKPCDTYSFNQLLCEHRIHREKVYVLGVPCTGMVDVEKLREKGIRGLLSVSSAADTVRAETLYGPAECDKKDTLLEKCLCCKGKKFMAFDELLGEQGELEDPDRFGLVQKLEQMTPEERFAFWQGELSRCIRCNACRNVCPACSCEKCVFDNDASGVAAKSNASEFEEKLFHIIRAFHVAGRCTDCGECSRVCPQHIPLHLLNRKFIFDIDRLYGEYQAGESPENRPPLVSYTKEDAEPSIVKEGGIQ